MLVKYPDLKIDSEQDYSSVSEISLTGGELNRVQRIILRTISTGIKISLEIPICLCVSDFIKLNYEFTSP